ncbi:hypothetical protein GPECTOR_61g812 [Gonium pectorale]|uniref:Receptor L-domain domain-containing protein n=1 Tax=Gonium pectorale TaxID=33097 RepID=A0A150G4P8_GONPE|nr:hypothetical protein GPECTOR_61g812 [Gonium pectorale]|eukprot:KXZ44859.1 hypothetical protein GPECTOR_61g812 [Gonium pectorale]
MTEDLSSPSGTTLVVFAGSGGQPDLQQVAAALPLDKKGLLPLGPGQAALLDLERPGACNPATLTSVAGNLLLFDNGTLAKALPSLSALSSVGSTLMVYGHAGLGENGLPTLRPLSNIKAASSVLLYNLDALPDLRGLGGIDSLTGDLIISDNARLANLMGLDSLRSVGRDLVLLSNLALTSVRGLQNLASIGGQLLAKGNGELRDLLALTSLTSLGALREVNNGDAKLELPVRARVGGAGAVAGSGTAAAGAPAAATPANGAAVTTAAVGGAEGSEDGGKGDSSVVLVYSGTPPSLAEVGDWLKEHNPPLPLMGIRDYNVRLVNMYDDEAKKLTTISGSLVIWATKDLGTGLWPLSGLTSVAGQLVVVGSSARDSELESLKGLENLKTVGGLNLLSLQRLRDLSGLSGLTLVRGDINIIYCASLESTRGLGPLASVYSDVYLANNPSLRDLDGFKTIRRIGWDLHLRELPELQSLAGLGALREVSGEVLIKHCHNLSSTAGLSALASVGKSIALLWNDALSDLSGFGRIGYVPSDLHISGNPSLTSLAPLANLTGTGLNLVLSMNKALADMQGLGSVARVGYLLSVSDNPSLKSLAGLGALREVGDMLVVHNNEALSSLADLDGSLQRVGWGGIRITDNWSLKSLGRLPSTLIKSSGPVTVRGSVSADDASALAAKGSDGSASARKKQ